MTTESMIGTTWTRKTDKHSFRIVAMDGQNWVLQDETEFSSPVAVPIAVLRSDYSKAADVPAPAPADESAGWARLSAEGKLAAMAAAVDLGDAREGDTLANGEVATHDDIRLLRSLAVKLSGRKAPSPEQEFAKADAKAIEQAADRIWNSADLLASYEIGAVDTSPSIAAVLDARIRERNALSDREQGYRIYDDRGHE